MEKQVTESWTRLSVRRGIAESDGPYEGVPPHLHHTVGAWLRNRFGWNSQKGMNNILMSEIASGLRIPVVRTHMPGGISDQIFGALETDGDLYLDCLDLTLHLGRGQVASNLDSILRTGGSAWRVNDTKTGLVRRADEATTDEYQRALSPGDAASSELREAWAAVYGRNPNPSDAWDHAIKAAEEVTIPLVIPKVPKANLGGVAGELKANPTLWTFDLPANGDRNNGELLEGLIRHIWPNPDRHGGASKRQPTQSEAEAAVQVAVTIVNLCRGRLTK